MQINFIQIFIHHPILFFCFSKVKVINFDDSEREVKFV